VPTVPVSGGVLAMTTGAAGAAAMVRVSGPVVAAGVVPLLAVTVYVLTPGLVGVPARTPALPRVRPAGSDPEETANVGAGTPEAVKV